MKSPPSLGNGNASSDCWRDTKRTATCRIFERQLVDTEGLLRDAQAADHQARSLLRVQSEALRTLFSEEARALRQNRNTFFEQDDLFGAQEPPETVSRLQATLASEGLLEGSDLATWQARLDRATDRVRHLRLVL